ncbi:hypothetical protein MaudMau93_008085 [Microsporum audouinii]
MATCHPLLAASTTVTSASPLDSEHVFFPPSKRLKLDHDGDEGICEATLAKFTINPCGTSRLDKPHTLYSIALIPRSRLPLSWLDTCPSPPRSIRPGSLFTANIPALESSLCGDNSATVLAARISDSINLDGSKEYFVVERVKRCIYAICALRIGIRETDLIVASKGSGMPDEYCSSQISSDLLTDCLEHAAITDLDSLQEMPVHSRQAVSFAFGNTPQATSMSDQAGGSEMSHDTTFSLPVIVTEKDPKTEGKIELGINLPAEYFADNQNLSQTHTVSNAEEMLSTLKTQYLEALYISKTSVAYFAKGPLSRARAAFQDIEVTSSMRPAVLYHYYRSCIIPMKKMDAKYKDSLPKIISVINRSPSDGDDAAPTKKKRKSKKKTLGKDGLYADEEDFISKWWKSTYENDSSVGKAALEGQKKRLIEDIRMRETQLQILLILEIMLLESSLGNPNELDGGNTEKPKKSNKKQQNMATALELLLDRLCIWHTVSSHMLPIEMPGDSNKLSAGPGKPSNNDKLRDFCTEVIIPFYSARLPEQCQVINRKLGGPAVPSPARPRRSNAKRSTNQLSKPAKGPASKRSLQRVRTDEKIPVRAKVPSLVRNNTAPPATEVKRENSDQLPLSAATSGRGGIQKPKRVNNREVDLEAVAKHHESKLKRMNLLVDQKRELDATIHALRKPNRELVARDIVESAEKRSMSIAAAHPRKQKNPTRNPFGQGVQVMATPKRPRTKGCGFADSSSLPNTWKRSIPAVTASPVPDADTQVVPSSSVRPTNANSLFKSQPALGTSHGDDLVYETPSKPPSNGVKRSATSKPVGSGMEHIPPQDEASPTVSRKSNSRYFNTSSIKFGLNTSTTEIGETPPRPKRATFTSEPAVPRRVDFMQPSTPTKGGNQQSTTIVTPLQQMRAGNDVNRTINETPEKSIYERLGWTNDDDNDELAFF